MMTIGLLVGNKILDNPKSKTLSKAFNQSPNNHLANEEKDKITNSFLRLKNYYEELSNTIDMLEGSIEDKLRKNELSQTEIHALYSWINENTAAMQWFDGYDEEYIKIFHTSKSIDEFKVKWLEFQEKQEEYTKIFHTSKSIDEFEQAKAQIQKLQAQEKAQNSNPSSQPTIPNNQSKEKAFTPIQTKSQKLKSKYNNPILQKLLEHKFDQNQMLKLLFATNFKTIDIKA